MAAATAKMSFWGSCLERDLHQHDGLHPLGCVKNRNFPVHEQRILLFQSKLWSSPAAIAVTSQIFPLREEGACLPSAHLCAALSFPAASPFTERDSFKPSRGGGRLTNQIHEQTSCSSSDESLKGSNGELIYESSSSFGNVDKDDIASHLPELKELLNLLRNDWRAQAARGPQRVGPGNVFLVGTGPGDPELLTLKALRLMQTADLVLYDRLVSTDILDMVHTGARLLYVGKTAGYHSRTQNEIHELLLSFAEAGALVLRLKGGDPLVFGRGGEEMDFLQQQGIQVKVVPGITAASGIAAELGIPLTHRGAANSVRFLTGHSQKGGSDPLHVAEQAADPESTLVVYMGLATLPALTSKLMANGLPVDTPAAAIERGTTTQQRTVFAKLKELTGRVASAQLVSPTLIIIGRVVALSPFWPHMASTTEGSSEKSVNISQTQFSLDITMQQG